MVRQRRGVERARDGKEIEGSAAYEREHHNDKHNTAQHVGGRNSLSWAGRERAKLSIARPDSPVTPAGAPRYLAAQAAGALPGSTM